MIAITTTMEKQIKPDWITDEQWKANPNVYHWERSRAAMKSVKKMQKQPPLTRAQIEQEMLNREASIALNRKD